MKNIRTLHNESVWKDHFLGLTIVLAFLLPHTSTLFQMVNPLLCLLLVQLSSGRKWSPIVFLPLVPIFISILFNLGSAQQKAILSTVTIMIYFMTFPMVSQMKVKNIYLYICLGVISISQLSYLLGVPMLYNIFETIYPISEEDIGHFEHMKNTITAETVFNYRLGGLYHNPNQCSKYLTFLQAFFLIYNRNKPVKELAPFALLSYFCILITGSRTGFVVSSLIMFFVFFRRKDLPSTYKTIMGAITIAGFAYFVANSSGLVRGLDVSGGLENSAGSKFNTFLFYLNNENSITSLIFGHLDETLFEGQNGEAMNAFDSEYGYLTYRFGLLGLVCIFAFWYVITKRMDKYNRIFMILLLWCVSSTIVCSFRAFFAFMVFLSIIYSNCHHGVVKRK